MKRIDKIHLSHSGEVFARSAQLFDAKWSDERLPDFCKYFKRYWINSHSGWFLGFAHKCPSTNNAMEGYNSVMKRNYTIRELLSLDTFNKEMFGALNSKSIRYATEEIVMCQSIENELWSKAIKWNNTITNCKS